jgi:hypothetical protein
MNEIEVPIKITGIGAIKKELRDLKGEIANATDSEQIRKLSQRAGELKDQLADANEQVNIFASGSKFEQVNNGLGSIKDSIMSLDFAEAGDKAKLLTGALKNINPADFAEQFKGFGKILGSLGSTIGILGKQFLSFGVSLLANPIFLLVAVITAIVAAILIFLNKIGVLKKVIDTLMAPVKALIQGFKDLTDWLGLTSFAAEENAAKMEAANERVMESSKKRQEAVVGGFEYEIKMAKIYGQDTLDLELGKSKAIGTEAKKRLSSAEKALEAQRALGDKANKETIKKLKTQIDDEKKLIIDQRRERNLLVAQDAVDKREEAKKDLEEDKKNNEAKRKARSDANKKAIDDAKKFAADRLAAQRTIRDIEISLIKEDSDREIVATQEKYARLIEDTIKNENLTKDEKIKLQQLYQKQLEAELGKQEQVELDAEKEKQKKLLDEYNAGLIKQAEEQDKQWLKLQELTTSKTEFEKTQLQVKYEQEIAAAESNAELQKALTTKLQEDLNAIDKKAAEDSVKITQEAEKKKRDAQLETANNALQIAESSTKAIQAVGDIAFAAKMSKVKKGSKEEEELAKKQFKFNKALQLAGAVVDAGKAITASLAAAPLAIGVVPNPIGIANLVATAAVSAANIAKIASTQFNSGGGGGGQLPSAPQASSTSTTAATPNVSLFGQGNDMNNVSAPQDAQQTQITVKAVVSETEITNTQQKIDKINQNATL